jgi:hypothetical protein
VLLDAKRDVGFIAALNSRLRVLIGYCFRRRDFPWVAVWEENRALDAPPWNRRTQARGLEFSSNPLPVLRRESFELGRLFGTPTFSCVPARSKVKTCYLAFLAQVPRGFGNVEDIRLTSNEVIVTGSGANGDLRLKASRLSAMGMNDSH